jgi:hypothetical protein
VQELELETKVIKQFVVRAILRIPGKFMDINLLAMTGGRVRTEKEFADLFAGADLQLTKVIHTHSPLFSIVEGVKA